MDWYTRSGFLFLLISALFNSIGVPQPTFFKSTFKGLRGIAPRVDAGEVRAAYFYDQTVAVVSLGLDNELHNCDLIEVYEPAEAMEVMRNLSVMLRPQQVSFQEMMKLMRQCEILDRLQADDIPTLLNRGSRVSVSSLSLLSGILPGTKWCGTGDIAENYHDLGQEIQIDRCCRNHDLCPVKVRAQQTRYNLTNYSLYTKSHCACDEALYQCLKAAKDPTADVIGHIYFNIIKVPCIEDTAKNPSTRASRRFIPVKIGY